MSTATSPAVSVIMPTYRQAAFVSRAVAGLLDQSFDDWELVVVDDGSPDDTQKVLAELPIPRLTYLRLEENQGIGHALNVGTSAATGRYLAYLPSDDVYDRDHLARAVSLLDSEPDLHLAYGGVRWYPDPRVNLKSPVGVPTLRDDVPPGAEGAVLDDPPGPCPGASVLDSGNFLALVQVVHRRDPQEPVRWTERSDSVSDRLEIDHWRALLRRGARFSYTGAVTCEWTDHPEQHHKIISGRGLQGGDWLRQEFGLSFYKQFYRIPPGTPLRWEPANAGVILDENVRYAGLPASPPPSGDGLRILVAGSLGFNPERLLALERQGHELFGLWMPQPHFWDTTGPLPFGRVEEIRPDEDWVARVREVRPDVIYGLLNWQALPFLHRVMEENRRSWGLPFVFHFKESPFFAQRAGYWPLLRDLVLGSDARIYSSPELRDWFDLAIPEAAELPHTVAMDGDLPSRDRMTDDWAARLSDEDGAPHTACVGRTLVGEIDELAARGVHVHVYTQPYMRFGSRWVGDRSSNPYLHLHDPVEPQNWVAELSRYDAAWSHIFDSTNGGDIRRASWDDLNLPARLGTYTAAGLPWIHRRNTGHRVAVNALAQRLGTGLCYADFDELASALRAECRTRALLAAVRNRRHELSFDHHVGDLVDLMRAVRK